MRDTILFDLDGTLLPYWQDDYLSAYVHSISKEFARLGFDPKAAAKALFDSSYMMIKNDGSRLNREVFFEDFAAKLGPRVYEIEPALDEYYRTGFSVVREVFREERDCRALIEGLREKGYTLVLATNPLFSMSAIETRLSWVNLTAAHFDHITHYENSRFCKPNLDYYHDLCDTLGRDADRCMMIGNSVSEDMIAEQLGMAVYLVHGYVENPQKADLSLFPGGSYADLCAMLDALPAVK